MWACCQIGPTEGIAVPERDVGQIAGSVNVHFIGRLTFVPVCHPALEEPNDCLQGLTSFRQFLVSWLTFELFRKEFTKGLDDLNPSVWHLYSSQGSHRCALSDSPAKHPA